MQNLEIFSEEQINSFFKTHISTNYNLQDNLEILQSTLRYYGLKEKNNEIVKKLFSEVIFLSNWYWLKSDFKTALIYYHTLELYARPEDIGIISYLEYVNNFIFLLSLNNQSQSVIRNVDGLNYKLFKHSTKNFAQKIGKFIKKNNTDTGFSWALILLTRIYIYGKSVANSIGLAENAGNYYYYQKYTEGFMSLNFVATGGFDCTLEFLNRIHQSYKMDHLTLNEPRSLKRKFLLYIKGILNRINFYTAGYGEKPFRIIITIIFAMIFFGVLYNCFELTTASSFLQNFYFSIFTFTSFGFYQIKDVTIIPKDNYFSMIIFISEIVLGIILNGLFIVALARKITR